MGKGKNRKKKKGKKGKHRKWEKGNGKKGIWERGKWVRETWKIKKGKYGKIVENEKRGKWKRGKVKWEYGKRGKETHRKLKKMNSMPSHYMPLLPVHAMACLPILMALAKLQLLDSLLEEVMTRPDHNFATKQTKMDHF
jgi:hypothetical protein